MAKRYRAPGKHFRAGLTLTDMARMFPDEAAAEAWFIRARWPAGMTCPSCESRDVVPRKRRKPLPFRCRACGKDFSVKTNSVMHKSKLSLRVWVYAIYLMTTALKGVSSMKLAMDLGITQKSAVFEPPHESVRNYVYDSMNRSVDLCLQMQAHRPLGAIT